jgi:hypothetical protein
MLKKGKIQSKIYVAVSKLTHLDSGAPDGWSKAQDPYCKVGDAEVRPPSKARANSFPFTMPPQECQNRKVT